MKIRHMRVNSRLMWFCHPKSRHRRSDLNCCLALFIMFLVHALLISTSATATLSSCSGTEADDMIRCSIAANGGEGAQVQNQDGNREQTTESKSNADTVEAEFKKASTVEEDWESSVSRQMWRSCRRRRRSLLGGLGSYPPRCMSKCGRCSPCKPVHVAVPPGTPVVTEYYPEAWRCKCGNRLYMP